MGRRVDMRQIKQKIKTQHSQVIIPHQTNTIFFLEKLVVGIATKMGIMEKQVDLREYTAPGMKVMTNSIQRRKEHKNKDT